MSTVEHQPLPPSSQQSQRSRGNHRRGRGRGNANARHNQTTERTTRPEAAPNQTEQTNATPTVARSARARNFGAQLSSTQPPPTVQSSDDKQAPKRHAKPQQQTSRSAGPSTTRIDSNVNLPDLTARLIETLKMPPYADCVICWSAIHPAQPTWSCTVSEETNRCCWGVFHNKCIVAWSKKSIEETRAAYRARNEDREGEWRCPGCQTQRTSPPGQYRCFCGAVVDPKAGRLAMPHSCGMSCQRPRASCDHPCPLECHPGPCPPCSALIVTPCHCGNTTLSLRCNRMTAIGDAPLSCGAICNKKLQCGTHKCQQICHTGECLPCGEVSKEKCYCGRNSRVLACGEGEMQHCTDGQGNWEGRFVCEETCNRDYNCGKHTCKEPCHPHSPSDSECPWSPNKVRTCSCGKNTLEDLGILRSSCTDPLPRCGSQCEKPLKNCDHLCAVPCHVGPCPPCKVEISRPCRCGETIQRIPCWQQNANSEFICTKVCRALRNCGKHVCNRPCCPLAHIVKAVKTKGRQGRSDIPSEGLSLHECDLSCGRLLNCGLHRCERKDHKGICPPCLQSSFDEMTCVCGRTTLIPPIPCGTQISCNYPCSRPPPPCGHPRTTHTCHQEGECPPCPFLTAKLCACGKMTLPNIRCSQPKVSCGTPCGKPLSCGFHSCQRLCHSDECGSCDSPCGKDRKLCLPNHHPCTQPCHAPSACPEVEPCQSVMTLECPCGRIKRQVTCGRSESTPIGRSTSMQPKCTSECQIAQRNARLAEALGIEPGKSALSKATYGPELVSFARANYPFVKMVEAAFAEFVASPRPTHTLPHMPEAKRSFVYGLAKVYRIDARMVDVEPHRSVELIKRTDTRIADPLLSAVTHQAMNSPSSLGKLQTKSPSAAPSPSRSTPVSLPPTAAAPGRAWAAVASSSRNSPAPPTVNLPGQCSNKSTPTRPHLLLTQPNEDDAVVPADWEADD